MRTFITSLVLLLLGWFMNTREFCFFNEFCDSWGKPILLALLTVGYLFCILKDVGDVRRLFASWRSRKS
jgi:hypothetical protein